MDPMSIVEDTERTRFCQQTDKVIPVYPPFQLRWSGGYNKIWIKISMISFKNMTVWKCRLESDGHFVLVLMY